MISRDDNFYVRSEACFLRQRKNILVVHPLKHHVFALAAGIQRSGVPMQLLVPLYCKGFTATLAFMPGRIGHKLRGYSYQNLDKRLVYSPLVWQARRLIANTNRLDDFVAWFDEHVSKMIRCGLIQAKVLVTLQDYMPKTVQAGKLAGFLIWSDQILNQSGETLKRINQHYESENISNLYSHSEVSNAKILAMADIITLPSHYTMAGVSGRYSQKAKVYNVPYGVDTARFSLPKRCQNGRIRVLVRANSVRKGGHLFVRSLEACSQRLLVLSKVKIVEFIVIGVIERNIEALFHNVSLPIGVILRSMNVPHVKMPELLASADLFVMPSVSESMSLVCIEAMQSGLPLIITPYCGIDCFQPGRMGLEVQDNVASLSEGLIEAFERIDEWHSWGLASKQAVADLGWDKYERVISEIAQNAINGKLP